jgi:hypothetical protein
MHTRKISLFIVVLLSSMTAQSASDIIHRQALIETAAETLSLAAQAEKDYQRLATDMDSMNLSQAFARLNAFQKFFSQARSVASRQEEEEEIFMERLKMSMELIPPQRDFQASQCGEYSFRIKQEMDGKEIFEELHPLTQTTLNILWKLCAKGGS